MPIRGEPLLLRVIPLLEASRILKSVRYVDKAGTAGGHAGDIVYVSGYGPMSGREAVYDGRSDNGRLRLMFDLFGRVVPIDIDQRDVSASTELRKRGRRRRHHRSRRRRKLQGHH